MCPGEWVARMLDVLGGWLVSEILESGIKPEKQQSLEQKA